MAPIFAVFVVSCLKIAPMCVWLTGGSKMELLARAAAAGRRSGAWDSLQESIETDRAAIALSLPTRLRPKQRPGPVIHRIDTRPLDIGADEVVAVGKLRNE